MPQDLYADASPEQAEAGPKPEPDSGSDSQTATIPKGVLGGKDFQPGEEVVLQVVQVMDDSVLVKYATDHEEKEEPHEEAPSPAAAPEGNPGGGGGMASMYS